MLMYADDIALIIEDGEHMRPVIQMVYHTFAD